jgi:hypothetical protein
LTGSQGLIELPAQWRVPAQIEKLTEAKAAEARGEYWSWAGKHLRWIRD